MRTKSAHMGSTNVYQPVINEYKHEIIVVHFYLSVRNIRMKSRLCGDTDFKHSGALNDSNLSRQHAPFAIPSLVVRPGSHASGE